MLLTSIDTGFPRGSWYSLFRGKRDLRRPHTILSLHFPLYNRTVVVSSDQWNPFRDLGISIVRHAAGCNPHRPNRPQFHTNQTIEWELLLPNYISLWTPLPNVLFNIIWFCTNTHLQFGSMSFHCRFEQKIQKLLVLSPDLSHTMDCFSMVLELNHKMLFSFCAVFFVYHSTYMCAWMCVCVVRVRRFVSLEVFAFQANSNDNQLQTCLRVTKWNTLTNFSFFKQWNVEIFKSNWKNNLPPQFLSQLKKIHWTNLPKVLRSKGINFKNWTSLIKRHF